MRRAILLLPAATILALSLAACGDSDTDVEGPNMRPGENCLSCHGFSAAGTVFTAAASGQGLAGATVKLTGSGANQVVRLTTTASGNFYTSAPLTPPIAVEVSAGGTPAAMSASAGSCNGCHVSGQRIHP